MDQIYASHLPASTPVPEKCLTCPVLGPVCQGGNRPYQCSRAHGERLMSAQYRVLANELKRAAIDAALRQIEGCIAREGIDKCGVCLGGPAKCWRMGRKVVTEEECIQCAGLLSPPSSPAPCTP